MATIKYARGNFTNELDAVSPAVSRFIEFVKYACADSHSRLDVVLKRDEFGNVVFTVNGSVPEVIEGYSYIYCCKLFTDKLSAIGYFK